MNSTIGMAVAILLLLAIIVWLFAAASRKQARKRRTEILRALHNKMEEQACKPGMTDMPGNRALALDETKTRLFYIDPRQDEAGIIVIELSEVKNCMIAKLGTRKSGEVKSEHIDKVMLELEMRNGERISLLFYEEAWDGVLEMLPLQQKAAQWKEVINKN